MREIKFRGWHVEKKKMFSAEEMAKDQMTLLPTGQFINVSGEDTRLSTIFPNDKFIPLQFTGLKDKNGKEIYEGDIVSYEYEPTEFENYIFKWGDSMAGFYAESSEDADYIYDMSREHMEVIGNIYENPDLLKS